MRVSDRKILAEGGLRKDLKAKHRKRRHDLVAIGSSGNGRARNDLLPRLALVDRDPRTLVIPNRNVRAADPAQIRAVAHSISVSGFLNPVMINADNKLINGVVSTKAAIELGLPTVPCIVVSHLSANEQRVVRLALNRLAERGRWSLPELKVELTELADAGIVIEDTGFTIPEFDQIVLADDVDTFEKGPLAPSAPAVSRFGDVWFFEGGHRLACSDATDCAIYDAVMREELARLVFTDVPYNVPIAGHVTKGDHREFAMASGEMTDEDFLTFNRLWITATISHLCDGGMLGSFIDWRGLPTLHTAATQCGATAMNLIVWAKTNAGMGSLYRSQHELFALFKNGTAPHVNNINLGRNGRWRSNVWTYPGASSVKSDARRGLELHPTVKPEAMCADAILDVTNRGDVVLDPFLGSGSTLLAAQRTGRRCYAIELDPLYVDVAIRRYHDVYGFWATLEATGEGFADIAQRSRGNEQAI